MTTSNLAVERFLGIEDPAVGMQYLRTLRFGGSDFSTSEGQYDDPALNFTGEELKKALLLHYSEQAVEKVFSVSPRTFGSCPDYVRRVLSKGQKKGEASSK